MLSEKGKGTTQQTKQNARLDPHWNYTDFCITATFDAADAAVASSSSKREREREKVNEWNISIFALSLLFLSFSKSPPFDRL